MRRRNPAPLVLLLLAAPAALAGQEPASSDSATPPAVPRLEGACVVARIVDGDTLTCASGERVRLLLIDTPELDQAPYGRRARRALAELLPPGTPADVELDVQPRDRYGRVLAYLYAPDGTFVNEALVRAGWAVVLVYPPNVRHVERLRAAAAAARADSVGLWATPAFECEPVAHRRGEC